MKISSLDEVKRSVKKSSYVYGNIEFLVNLHKASTLVVLFHGGRQAHKTPLPIFRGHNYFFKDRVVMSISDPLYRLYPVNIGWYVDTERCPITDRVVELVKGIKERAGAIQ